MASPQCCRSPSAQGRTRGQQGQTRDGPCGTGCDSSLATALRACRGTSAVCDREGGCSSACSAGHS